jgi:hypothetical protein
VKISHTKTQSRKEKKGFTHKRASRHEPQTYQGNMDLFLFWTISSEMRTLKKVLSSSLRLSVFACKNFHAKKQSRKEEVGS